MTAAMSASGPKQTLKIAGMFGFMGAAII